ncbi:MAG: hypothetical protein ACTSXU_01155 [Promethearchaeota archaeon]
MNIKRTSELGKDPHASRSKSENKFYGVTKLNKRGQIVLPKDSREDLAIVPKESLVLLAGVLPHSKDAFLLIKAKEWYTLPDDAPIKDSRKHEFCGHVKVAERGQVVIPKAVRERYKIDAGTYMLVLSHETLHAIILAILNPEQIGSWAKGKF